MGFANTDVFFSSIASGNVHRTDFSTKYDGFTATASGTVGSALFLASSNSLFGQCTFPTPSGNLTWTACSDTSGFGIPHGGNVAPSSKHIISAMAVTPAINAGANGALILVDLQGYWGNISLASSSSQPLSGDPSANLRYANGEGCLLFTVVTANTGATNQNVRVHYTNQANVSLRNTGLVGVRTSITPGIIHSSNTAISAGSNNPSVVFLPLVGSDTGVSNVSNIQYSATSSGLVALCLARPLIYVPLTTSASYVTEREFLYQTPSLPEVKDGACLVWLYLGAASASVTQHANFEGALEFAWG